MRDQELELIAALVEGRLENEAEARALVDSGPEFRAEYVAQKTAYEALTALGSATLTETERAGLRRDLWTELRAEQAAPASQKTPWYYRWVPALAGMFVVIGLVAVVGNLSGEDSSGEVVAELSAETTVAASSDVTEAADADVEANADSGGDEAMEEDADGGSQQPEDRSVTPAATSFYSTEADMVRSGALDEAPIDSGAGSENGLAPCLEAADLAGYEPLSVLTSPIQTGDIELDESIPVPSESSPIIVAVPEGADMSSAVVAFVDRGSCEVVHLDN